MMLRWLLLATLLPAPALAQGIDLSQGGPIDITAQSGIEWQQNQHRVIASGNATAVRQNVTVDADRLIAYYRKKTGSAATPAAATQAAVPPPPRLPPPMPARRSRASPATRTRPATRFTGSRRKAMS